MERIDPGTYLLGAFSSCNLKSITLPSTIVDIGDFAFYNCQNLKNITFGNNVRIMRGHLFRGCSNLNLSIPESVTQINDRAFEGCKSFTGDLYLPNLDILQYAVFIECGIVSISHLGNITSLVDGGYYAGDFSRCKSLIRVDLRTTNSLRSIGIHSFSGCTSLETVFFPNSLENIGDRAFWECPITRIDIPCQVNYIGEKAFLGSKPTEIIIRSATPPSLSNDNFNKSSCPIYVPASSVEVYKTAANWSDYASRIQAMPDE